MTTKRPADAEEAIETERKSLKLCEDGDTSERNSAVLKLSEWLTANGSDISIVRVGKSTSGGLGVFARENVEKGKSLFKIAQKCVMSSEKLKLHAYGKLILAAAKQAELPVPSDELVLQICMAVGRKDPTFHFYPFLNALPTHAPDPVNWEESEKEWLMGSTAHFTIAETLASLKESADALTVAIVSYAQTHAENPDFKGLESVFTNSALNTESLLWARGMYVSRRFPVWLSTDAIEDQQSEDATTESAQTGSLGVMVPFLDLLNHVHGETVMWELASDEKKHVLFSNKDKEHKEGDEVFNNYGYKTVEELFLSHGFCGTGTGHKDVVALRVGSPAVSKEVDEAKVAILRDMEVPVAVRPNGNLSVGPLYLVTGSAEEPILNQELLLSMAVCGMAHIPTDEEPIEIGIDELDVLKAQLGHKLEILGDLSWILETLNSNVKGESTPHTHHTRKVQAALYVKGQVDLLNEALGEIVKFLPVPDGEESEEEEEHEEGV